MEKTGLRKFFIPLKVEYGDYWGFLGGSAGKESSCNAGDPHLIPGSGSSPGEGIGYPLQLFLGFPGDSDSKESTCNVGDWV